MSHIAKLVDRATSTINKKPLKIGKFEAIDRNGRDIYVTDFLKDGNHFATLTIYRFLSAKDNDGNVFISEAKSRVELYKSISGGVDFLLALKEHYPHIEVDKKF